MDEEVRKLLLMRRRILAFWKLYFAVLKYCMVAGVLAVLALRFMFCALDNRGLVYGILAAIFIPYFIIMAMGYYFKPKLKRIERLLLEKGYNNPLHAAVDECYSFCIEKDVQEHVGFDECYRACLERLYGKRG